MQPKAMNVLKQAAVSGPIIVLATTDSTCFALIVTATKEVQCLKLAEMILPVARWLSDLARALSNQAGFDLHTFLEPGTRSQEQSELLDRLFGAREGSINVDPDDVFRGVLAYLWKDIVKPVFDELKLEASTMFSVDHIFFLYPCRSQIIHCGYGGAQLALLPSFPFMPLASTTKK
jgi:hypothetical protein